MIYVSNRTDLAVFACYDFRTLKTLPTEHGRFPQKPCVPFGSKNISPRS